jgi:hypothetical protein
MWQKITPIINPKREWYDILSKAIGISGIMPLFSIF